MPASPAGAGLCCKHVQYAPNLILMRSERVVRGGKRSPVSLVNLFTLDKADEPALLKAWEAAALFMKRPAGLHLDPASSCDRRQRHLPELRRLGVHGCLRRRVPASRVRIEALGLPLVCGGDPVPLPKGLSPQCLRLVATTTEWGQCNDQSDPPYRGRACDTVHRNLLAFDGAL